VKLIWKDTYEHTFPNTAEDKIMNKELQENFLLFLQSLSKAGLRSGMSDQGDLQAPRATAS